MRNLAQRVQTLMLKFQASTGGIHPLVENFPWNLKPHHLTLITKHPPWINWSSDLGPLCSWWPWATSFNSFLQFTLLALMSGKCWSFRKFIVTLPHKNKYFLIHWDLIQRSPVDLAFCITWSRSRGKKRYGKQMCFDLCKDAQRMRYLRNLKYQGHYMTLLSPLQQCPWEHLWTRSYGRQCLWTLR